MTKTQLIIAYLRTNPTATSRVVAAAIGVEYNKSFKSLVTKARNLMADPETTLAKEREARARFRAANPQKVREANARYYAVNPEKVREKMPAFMRLIQITKPIV